MAERWEHMVLRSSYVSQDAIGDRVWMQVIGPDGTYEDHPRPPTIHEQVRVMNRLGREGWHLVATEWEDRSGGTYRLSWLRRRVSGGESDSDAAGEQGERSAPQAGAPIARARRS